MHIFDLPIRNTFENACFEELANLRRIGALRTICALHTISRPPSGFCSLHPDFVYFREKKQNEKFSHENEGKNRRPKRAPIIRGAKAGANYAEFGKCIFRGRGRASGVFFALRSVFRKKRPISRVFSRKNRVFRFRRI